MAAIPVNIVVDRHANYDVTFFITNKDGTPLNMTGYTGEAAFKTNFSQGKYNVGDVVEFKDNNDNPVVRIITASGFL